MKQSTQIKENTWLGRCRESSCELERKKCPVCKKYGHITIHVNTDKEGIVDIKISHAHFVENQDAGRNISHKISDDRVPLSEIIKTWRLTKEGRDRLIRKWSGKFG
jgi:hypothetical protein